MKISRVLLVLAIVGACLVALTSCRPITYYLEQVYKAEGKVTSAGSGSPVGSVEVSIDGYLYSDLTNYYGDYELELPEGTWILNFVKDAYVTSSAEVTVGPEPGHEIARVDVELALDPQALIGSWTLPPFRAPHAPVMRFDDDGSFKVFPDYAETETPELGTWSLDGDFITQAFEEDDWEEETFLLEPFGSDRYRLWEVSKMDWMTDLYRKGTEPLGNLFDLPTVPLELNTWYEDEGSLNYPEFVLFSFTAETTGTYEVAWSYPDGVLEVIAYDEDEETILFWEEDGPVSLDITEAPRTVFLYVQEAEGPSGGFSIIVQN